MTKFFQPAAIARINEYYNNLLSTALLVTGLVATIMGGLMISILILH